MDVTGVDVQAIEGGEFTDGFLSTVDARDPLGEANACLYTSSELFAPPRTNPSPAGGAVCVIW